MDKKVLVVDDEPLFCEMVRRFLEGRGYSVVEAYDGDQALVVYDQARPDVILLDVRMPGKDGLQVLRELKVIDPAASVIMVAAVRDEELARMARAEGALEYITKPVDLDYLDSVIATTMELIDADA
ncbi:MAG: response regulator [Nitrospinae bacterium]|nr:response regulator [Nitrospinota bacterium]MCH7769050.1 response regulator [Nitrospinota bacterium]